MSKSTVYISIESRTQLRELARKTFMKESEILEKLISDTHEKMKNLFGSKFLWKRLLSKRKDNLVREVI